MKLPNYEIACATQKNRLLNFCVLDKLFAFNYNILKLNTYFVK